MSRDITNNTILINQPDRKKQPVLKLWHKLLFLSPILIIIFIYKGNDWYREYQLQHHGAETYAIITKISTGGVRDPFEIENVAFNFSVNNKIYTGFTLAETNNNYAFAGNGLPLFVGDKYKIRYNKEDPEVYITNLTEPDSLTIHFYYNKAVEVLKTQGLFKTSSNSDENIRCFVKNIFLKYSYDGLATILFYNEYMAENISHNSLTFKRFMNKKEVKEMIKHCSE